MKTQHNNFVGLYAEITGKRNNKKRYMQLVPSSVGVEDDINVCPWLHQRELNSSVLINRHFRLGSMCDNRLDVYWNLCILLLHLHHRTLHDLCKSILLSIAFLFLLASMIPYMLFSARSACVKAFIGGSQIPDSVVKSVARSLSVNGECFFSSALLHSPWIWVTENNL